MRRSLAILLLAPERRPGTLLRRPAGTVPPPLPEPGDRDRAGHRGADRPGGRHARGQRARGVGEAAARVLSSRSQAHNECRA